MSLFLSFAFTAGKIPDVVVGLLLLFLYALGKVVVIEMEGEGRGNGRIALGDFGPSPGDKREDGLYRELLALHLDIVSVLQT